LNIGFVGGMNARKILLVFMPLTRMLASNKRRYATSMTMEVIKRPLDKLTAWASSLLQLDGWNGREKVREYFIEVAGRDSPNKTFDLVRDTARNRGFSPEEAEKIAKAARWLAIIRRDYGQEEFNKLVSQ
jgi:hypothetical protein